MSDKMRLDLLLVERGLEESRQRAQAVIMSGVVYVDGQPLDEPYINEIMTSPISPEMSISDVEVPEGSIFVMGDNRNHSTDSRHVQLGSVDTGYVLGKAVFALWPMEKLGPIH